MVMDFATAPRTESPRTAANRVLGVLGAFSHGRGALTLTEIARYADLPLTTAHRLAREVVAWGGLELDETGKYRLSRKILDLASSSTYAMRLRESALPHLSELHRTTCLTVHLAVRDGDEVLYLEALRSHTNYSGENRMGGRMPLHATATGLVLLAYAQECDIEDYLRGPLQRYTPKTVTDPDELRSTLAGIRASGHARLNGTISPRAGSVAAPVFGDDGTVETAVGSVFILERDDPARLIDAVRITATRIARSLACRNDPPHPATVAFNRRKAGLA
ncbi:IclR family transcriptional regulator [Microbacterium caowuchunii]|uniref:IclR family transcriptional regulator n=1 Tax=Microbacterium caowuchunii TaxID=2614638 RepID=A0A5N0TB95_9MICO|nr:IclR family transcriptional regulator [Microbacterium caowuchunii]KAA9132262.1 IclR family transcriptional regulator [Microbacterium caowuchunii]